MKIAYIVYDFTRPGGIERYVRELSQRMADKGHEIHVITAISPEVNKKNVQFHIVRIPKAIPGILRFMVFKRGVDQFLLKHNFDIIHSQGTDCLIHNVLTAHSCHKAWVEKAKTFGWWEYLKKSIHPMHRIIVRNEETNYSRYERIIAVSAEVKREIVACHGVPEKDIEVIYPGVDVEKFNPEMKKSSVSFRKRLGLKDEDFVILFVANEFRRKGLSVLISAMGILKDTRAKLVVVGQGFQMPYVFMARKAGVVENIVFTGPIANVSEYFLASDLFAMPTKHEAFGLVITEAMASGLPVIVTKLAGAAELIKDENCLLKDPMDPVELSDKIRVFMENRTLTEATGKAMRKTVESCTWDAMAEKVAGVYGTFIK